MHDASVIRKTVKSTRINIDIYVCNSLNFPNVVVYIEHAAPYELKGT